ncbi:uncharacterized protein L3040_004777 [Drepanopeziza brunnea f. sp. 'multigermtubi']|nr:hypothetical protein L3040_004777 [Drepanopeziza brunnea f. sp. 'multigermtubi']
MIPRAPIPSFTPLQRISSRFVSSVDLESSELFDVPPPRSTRWNVQGVYDVTSVVDGYVDTAGFSLRLFYYNLGDQSQLFAKFAFDKLEGMMRLCPYEAVSTSGVKLELEEFEKACDLPRQMEPSPLRRSWWMRWRAKDGGMRLGELVGGLPDLNYEFSFEEEEGSASKDNIGLRILFVMVYNENHFVFRGKKVANLEDETAPSRWEQRALWNSLWNWEWDPVPDSWSDSSSDSDEDFVARLRRGGSSIRENKSKIKRTIKTKIPTGPSGLSSASTPINKHIELPPLGAFDVTGIWQIEAQHLRSHLGISDKDGNRGCMYITVKMANNPRHHKIGRQLWADFRLGPRVCGVMRFCPRPNSEEEQRITLPLKEFEKACVLESACWPGPSPEGKGEWYMRWRGVYKSREISRDQADYRVSFKKDDDGKVKMRGVIELDSLMFPWTAERLFAAMPPARNEPSVTKTWSEARPEHDRILSRSEWFTGLV